MFHSNNVFYLNKNFFYTTLPLGPWFFNFPFFDWIFDWNFFFFSTAPPTRRRNEAWPAAVDHRALGRCGGGSGGGGRVCGRTRGRGEIAAAAVHSGPFCTTHHVPLSVGCHTSRQRRACRPQTRSLQNIKSPATSVVNRLLFKIYSYTKLLFSYCIQIKNKYNDVVLGASPAGPRWKEKRLSLKKVRERFFFFVFSLYTISIVNIISNPTHPDPGHDP